MQATIIGVGLCMLALAGGLSGVGHYDGVLGAVEAEAFQGPDLPEEATMRVRIRGTPEEARAEFGAIRATFVLPARMEAAMAESSWVPVDLLFADGSSRPAFLESDQRYEEGAVLVIQGTPRAYWPLMDTGSDLEAAGSVLFIHPDLVREPLLFKR